MVRTSRTMGKSRPCGIAIATAGDRTPEAAIRGREVIFSQPLHRKVIERDAPPDTGEVRSEANPLVDAVSACRYSAES